MNKCKYIVSWHQPGFIGSCKLYKYRKSAFTFAHRLKIMFSSETEVMVEEMQERQDGKVIRTGRWEI